MVGNTTFLTVAVLVESFNRCRPYTLFKLFFFHSSSYEVMSTVRVCNVYVAGVSLAVC